MMPVEKLKNIMKITPIQNSTSESRDAANVGRATIRCTQLWLNVTWQVHITYDPNSIFQNVCLVVRSIVMLFKFSSWILAQTSCQLQKKVSKDLTLAEKSDHRPLLDPILPPNRQLYPLHYKQLVRLTPPSRMLVRRQSKLQLWCHPFQIEMKFKLFNCYPIVEMGYKRNPIPTVTSSVDKNIAHSVNNAKTKLIKLMNK